MGCCFTKPVRQNHPQNGRPTTPHPHPHRHHNTPTQESCRATVADRAPPPSVEEEYVKEVLSETPLPNIHHEASAAVVIEKKPLVGEEKVEAEEEEEVEKVSAASEILEMSEVSQSQVSEMCSASESYSTATTFTDKRDDEVVSKPSGGGGERVTRSPLKAPRKRPHSGDVSGARERFAKSPARRVQPSPGAARTSRGAAQSRTWQQNVGVRRDPGESSGRRSRSPVTRGAGGAGRGSMGRSPMKKPVKPGGRSENGGVAAAESESQKQSKEEEEPPNGVVPQQGNESLENPHVSMECFIFL